MLLLALLFLMVEGHPLQVEEAKTEEQKTWGLMARSSLGENEGMLFSYDPPEVVSVWMFNCLIDLDVAFLNQNMTIREIHEMAAYPAKMDPRRPVLSVNDLRQYPPNDPIVSFFRKKSATSSFEASYILEMPKGWFKNHNINIGSTIRSNYE